MKSALLLAIFLLPIASFGDTLMKNYFNEKCPLEKINNGQMKWDFFSAEQVIQYCDIDPVTIIPRHDNPKQCPPRDQDLSNASAWEACPAPANCSQNEAALVQRIGDLRLRFDRLHCGGHATPASQAEMGKIKKELEQLKEPMCLMPFNSSPTKLVVHHSALSPLIGPEGIQRSHIFTRDFADIGYHYVISLTPHGGWKLFEGRPIHATGAHVGSGLNGDSIAVVIAGNYAEASSNSTRPSVDLPQPPPQAMLLLMGLTEKLKKEFEFSKIYSHSELKHIGSGCGTECPATGCRHMVQSMNERYFQ
jgi:hypothetical protein